MEFMRALRRLVLDLKASWRLPIPAEEFSRTCRRSLERREKCRAVSVVRIPTRGRCWRGRGYVGYGGQERGIADAAGFVMVEAAKRRIALDGHHVKANERVPR